MNKNYNNAIFTRFLLQLYMPGIMSIRVESAIMKQLQVLWATHCFVVISSHYYDSILDYQMIVLWSLAKSHIIFNYKELYINIYGIM